MEDVAPVWRARLHMGGDKISSNLIFWHPRVFNEAPYVGTPGAGSVSDLTGHSYFPDIFVLAVAEMIEMQHSSKALVLKKSRQHLAQTRS